MHELDRAIINSLQGGLPICEQPFLEAARRLDMTEKELLWRLQYLLETGKLSRVGPLYNVERMGGAFTLAALHAPAGQLEAVSAKVNAHCEVAHNYERDHELNMWFVIAAETPNGIERVIREIESETGCEVFNFPKSHEYFVEMKLSV
jgi:siroheme decarboxylase